MRNVLVKVGLAILMACRILRTLRKISFLDTRLAKAVQHTHPGWLLNESFASPAGHIHIALIYNVFDSNIYV